MIVTLEGTIHTAETVTSFEAAEELIRRLIPSVERVWISRVSVEHYDISIFGDALPNHISGPSEVQFKAAGPLGKRQDCEPV